MTILIFLLLLAAIILLWKISASYDELDERVFDLEHPELTTHTFDTYLHDDED